MKGTLPSFFSLLAYFMNLKQKNLDIHTHLNLYSAHFVYKQRNEQIAAIRYCLVEILFARNTGHCSRALSFVAIWELQKEHILRITDSRDRPTLEAVSIEVICLAEVSVEKYDLVSHANHTPVDCLRALHNPPPFPNKQISGDKI